MHVEKTHHVDASEPDADGLYEWRYEYDLYSFSDASISVVARTYVLEPDAVYFLHIEQGSLHRGITPKEFSLPVFHEAMTYLRDAGFRRVEWLGASGYEPVPEV
jgi:hypothetical protein